MNKVTAPPPIAAEPAAPWARRAALALLAGFGGGLVLLSLGGVAGPGIAGPTVTPARPWMAIAVLVGVALLGAGLCLRLRAARRHPRPRRRGHAALQDMPRPDHVSARVGLFRVAPSADPVAPARGAELAPGQQPATRDVVYLPPRPQVARPRDALPRTPDEAGRDSTLAQMRETRAALQRRLALVLAEEALLRRRLARLETDMAPPMRPADGHGAHPAAGKPNVISLNRRIGEQAARQSGLAGVARPEP